MPHAARGTAGHRHCSHAQLQCRRAHAIAPPYARYSAAAPGSDKIHRESGTSTVGGGRSPNPVHDWIHGSPDTAPGSDKIHRESGTSTVGGGRSPNPVHDWIHGSFRKEAAARGRRRRHVEEARPRGKKRRRRRRYRLEAHRLALTKLVEQMRQNQLEWTRTSCSKLLKRADVQSERIHSKYFPSIKSTSLVRRLILIDGYWTVAEGTDPWWRCGCRSAISRKRKQLQQRPYVDAFARICIFIEPVQDLDSRPPYSAVVRRL
ncbi:hypothetical protein F511_23197 [Dorcoceras hygrometricum]|uniref:Uncharacterized protein n=1 Tax=Dorcoceras hygrometricum TaxID=472368 RepID=A0A2Z7APW7_9LAMI|nr:hypothetical protein F511_23197 [Dorcoceras hygrometricum]